MANFPRHRTVAPRYQIKPSVSMRERHRLDVLPSTSSPPARTDTCVCIHKRHLLTSTQQNVPQAIVERIIIRGGSGSVTKGKIPGASTPRVSRKQHIPPWEYAANTDTEKATEACKTTKGAPPGDHSDAERGIIKRRTTGGAEKGEEHSGRPQRVTFDP